MLENLSNDDIQIALDELVSCIGVREEARYDDLLSLIRKKDVQGCVQEIAARFGLPVHISLSYVPKGYRLSGDGFQSSALSKTDYGGESTMAQVTIPTGLPMFGTSDLQDYPIHVRVTEGCHMHPETFVTVMLHELAHILLRALRHPMKESELHTDLVPILLGFRSIIATGRKAVHRTTSGNVTTTHTTTYGYLTDSHFSFACDRATGILKDFRQDKKRIVGLVAKLRRELDGAVQHITSFHNNLKCLDARRTTKMKHGDAQRVVQFHAWNYAHD